MGSAAPAIDLALTRGPGAPKTAPDWVVPAPRPHWP